MLILDVFISIVIEDDSISLIGFLVFVKLWYI